MIAMLDRLERCARVACRRVVLTVALAIAVCRGIRSHLRRERQS
jgi:hypothetical protein